LTNPPLYLFRGETVWRAPLRGIPEDEDLKRSSLASLPTTVPTAIPRDVEVEEALRTVQGQHPDADVRIPNWHRQKRDV
jgi:hypothetical protein